VTLPRVQPIIPTWRKEPFDDPEWVFDFKYDGFRGLCYIEQGRCRFISRNCNVLSRFEALGDEVATVLLGVDDAVIDGEVIAPDETGRPQFYDLIRRTRTPLPMWLSIFCGLLVPTFALSRSASVESGSERFCRRSPRSSLRRYPSPAEAGNSSN